MDKNLSEKIISSNKSIWQNNKYSKIAKKGLYEVYFLIFHNYERNESYWIRYTLVCNKSIKSKTKYLYDKEPGQGLLWFGYFNSVNSTKNFMVKKHFPLSEVKGTYEKEDKYYFLTVNNSYIGLNKIKGNFKTRSNKEYSWDLNLSDFQMPYDVVPKLAKYLKISNTINKVTHPHIKVSGKIVLNGEERIIDKCNAIQYHTYADGYKVPWEWFSIYTISEWPKGFIDFSYKVDKGILEINNSQKHFTPWNQNIIKKLTTSKLLKRAKSIHSLNFNLDKKNIQISGSIDVDEKDLIGVEYIGPTGEKFYCYNSEVANGKIQIDILDKNSKEHIINEFFVHKSVAFETTYKAPVEELKYMPWDEEEYFPVS